MKQSRDELNRRRIAVLGSGSWGTTFAKVIADATAEDQSHEVVLWARRPELAQEINEQRTNAEYLGEIPLPESISATSELAEAVQGADMVVLAVPAQSLRDCLERLRGHIPDAAVLVSLIKGLERGTDMRVSEVISEVLGTPSAQVAVVSGPNLAMEIAREEPTASVVACADLGTAEAVAALCSSAYFRPYTNTDVVGVELAGVIKNVIALAVGVCDGQGLGDNAKASVITRGLTETTRLAMAVGGSLETFAGLAGLGDLVATSASPLSRNRRAGRLLGDGKNADQTVEALTQTAEGMKSASAVVHLARRHGVEMPISEAVVAILEGSLPVEQVPGLLMARGLKSEAPA